MLILPCKCSVQMINNGCRNAELCHGQDVDNIGNDSVHADKFRTHIQIHCPLAEKSKNQECKLRKHTEKAVSK